MGLGCSFVDSPAYQEYEPAVVDCEVVRRLLRRPPGSLVTANPSEQMQVPLTGPSPLKSYDERYAHRNVMQIPAAETRGFIPNSS